MDEAIIEIPMIITSSFLENTFVLKLMNFHLRFEDKNGRR